MKLLDHEVSFMELYDFRTKGYSIYFDIRYHIQLPDIIFRQISSININI